ncbi:MAG: alpha/beta fold hydrolase [Myxococcales bacterium]|nr:MAG: alpha/beta fold hydrolase [Myxococcales bacterium]
MAEQAIRFAANLRLAGKWAMPDPCRGVIVFSHPHPLYGGNKDNNVVRLGCHALNALGWATLRYDFRGAGQSTGEHDGGVGEQDDLLQAILEARQRGAAALPLFLVGYSFGSYVTWAALDRVENVAGVALISPPFGFAEIAYAPRPTLTFPVLAIAGERDDFCPATMFRDAAPKLAPQIAVEVVPGVDHFWMGREKELAGKLGEWLREKSPIQTA